MENGTLLERGAQRPLEPVLQVELAAPRHDVGEEISVERRVLREEDAQVELGPYGGELVEAHDPRRNL